MSAGDLYTSSRADDHHSSHLHDTNAKSTTSTSSHTALDKQQPYIPPSAPSPPRTRRPSSPVPPHQRNPPGHHFSQPVAAFPPGGAAMASSELEPSSQWLFTAAEMADTPSVRDGLTVAEESCRRAKGVNFIIQTGILLKIPQLTLGTAAVFFHRFYMRYSMVVEKGGIHHYNIAATALFLATKAEENCRKTKEIVIAVVKVAQKNASLIIDEQSKEFWRWKDSILLYEETMLELLTFDVVLESPYNCLYNALKILGMESNKNMRNVSWSFVNDSIMTHLCLLLPPKDIAVAAIYFAAQFTHEAIPDVDGGAWWERLRGRPERIEQAVDVMTEFFTDNPLKKSDNPYEKEGSEKSFDEELEGTRLRTGSQSVSPNGGEGEEHRAEDIPWGGDDGHGNGNEVDGAEGRSPPKDTVPDATVPPTSSTNGKGENHLQSQLSLAAASTSAATPGDDDTTLKALANDPATHEHHDSGAHHDGAAAAAAAASTTSDAATAERATAAPAPRPLANGFGAESPRKRKGSEDVHVMAIDAVITDSHADADADTNEPEAKRLRTEDPAGTGTGTESEEGEVEE